MCFIATATTSEHAEQCITARRQRGNHLLVGQDLALVVQWFLWHKCENDFKIIIEIIYHLFVLILDWCCYQLIYSRPKYFSGIGSKNINGTFFSLVPSWLKKKAQIFVAVHGPEQPPSVLNCLVVFSLFLPKAWLHHLLEVGLFFIATQRIIYRRQLLKVGSISVVAFAVFWVLASHFRAQFVFYVYSFFSRYLKKTVENIINCHVSLCISMKDWRWEPFTNVIRRKCTSLWWPLLEIPLGFFVTDPLRSQRTLC